jgi:hypothetical protein
MLFLMFAGNSAMRAMSSVLFADRIRGIAATIRRLWTADKAMYDATCMLLALLG